MVDMGGNDSIQINIYLWSIAKSPYQKGSVLYTYSLLYIFVGMIRMSIILIIFRKVYKHEKNYKGGSYYERIARKN